jgi:predicted Zn-dependent protease
MPSTTDFANSSITHNSGTHLIEIGWIVAGRLDDPDRQAFTRARHHLLTYVQQTFAEFTWRMPMVHREELVRTNREEPVVLLDYGVVERDAKHWDFAFIVTNADLISHYKPYALGAPSRAVSVAVMSTARLDQQTTPTATASEERITTMANRIVALALHLSGHLNGLPHHEDPHRYMYDLQTTDDLDRMASFSPAHEERLRAILREVADVCLEEEPTSVRAHPFWFYAHAAWTGRDDIISAIVQAKPWSFPFRLTRLTTAAVSALLLLLVTAEVWELGMSQSAAQVIGLSIGALLLTCIYTLLRQRLLVRRQAGSLSEQTVITNIAITSVVGLGMLTTYGWLFSSVLGLSLLIFRRPVVAGWVVALDGEIRACHYVVLAAFVASLGILIGALGASFEQQHYFRHITYVDEET